MKKKSLGILSAIILGTMTLATPPRMQAQSATGATTATTATPAQVVDQLLTMVESEMVPLAEAMPADKYNFAPTNGDFKGVRTFGEQVTHVARANYWMFGSAASIKPDNMPDMKSLKTKAQMVQALKDSFVFGHRAIATLNNDNALEEVKPVEGHPDIGRAVTMDAFGQDVVVQHMGFYLRDLQPRPE